MSAIEKIGPLIHVSMIWIGSIGQLHFVSSINVFNWRLSKTIFSDSPFFEDNNWVDESISRSEGICVYRCYNIKMC